MKKLVYELFVVKNKILLDSDCIEYIAGMTRTKSDVEHVYNMYTQAYKYTKVGLAHVKSFFDTTKDLFVMYENEDDIDKYGVMHEAAKKSIESDELTKIDDLKDNKATCIFGLLYKNRQDKYCMKDKTGKIELNMDDMLQKQHTNVFVMSGMFLTAKGHKNDNKFVVHDFLLPGIQKDVAKVNTNLANKDFCMLIFARPIEKKKIEYILANFDTQPEIAVINIETSKDLRFAIAQDYAFANTRVILIINSDLYLDNIENINKVKNDYVLDCCTLQFYNKLLSFQNSKYDKKLRAEGIFIGNDIELSYAQALTSQQTCNFANNHLEMLPNKQDMFFVFTTNKDTYQSIANTNFVCHSTKTQNSFYFYDSTTNACEYSQYD